MKLTSSAKRSKKVQGIYFCTVLGVLMYSRKMDCQQKMLNIFVSSIYLDNSISYHMYYVYRLYEHSLKTNVAV